MIFELTYRSRAQPDLSDVDVQNILSEAIAFNEKHQITGCLVLHKSIFMQILEGDKKIVQELFKKIQKDPRHYNVQLLNEGEKPTRSFDQWNMAFQTFSEKSQLGVKSRKLFENNLLMLSEFIDKPTKTIQLFWINVHHSLISKSN